MTFEYLMKKALSNVPSHFDKREQSIIYTALAPVMLELAESYTYLDLVLDEGFADTASYTYLIRRAAERGIFPYEETYATWKAEVQPFNIKIALGTRFSGGDLLYTVLEPLEEGGYKLECETAGSIGNTYFGAILPIENEIKGLQAIRLTELLIPGTDDEDVEHFRNRYFSSFRSQAFGGNQADYKEKVGKIAGVGGVKVYPTWNGGGTVKIVIQDATYQAPSATLVSLVQETIDPVKQAGDGVGIAPIGHIVTIEGVKPVEIRIQTSLVVQNISNEKALSVAIEETLQHYFQELAETWANSEAIIVRMSQIEARLLDLEGVIDIQETTLNEQTQNLILESDQIPVLKGVVLL